MSERKLMSQRFRTSALALLFALTGGVFLAACDNEGPAEEAGENIDEAVEETTDGSDDYMDETKETVEEGMEETGEAAEEAADEVEEATD